MRKVSQEQVTSVPPQTDPFNEALEQYRVVNRGSPFHRKLCQWLDDTIIAADGALRHLHKRYRINPGEVLDALLPYKVVDFVFGDTKRRAADKRSKSRREGQAKVLEKAQRVLEEWESDAGLLTVLGDEYSRRLDEMPGTLKGTAVYLRALPAVKHRPPETTLVRCAKGLSVFFAKKTGMPLYEYIGELLKAGFPKKWNTDPDPLDGRGLREAAKKLVKKEMASIDKFSVLSTPTPDIVNQALDERLGPNHLARLADAQKVCQQLLEMEKAGNGLSTEELRAVIVDLMSHVQNPSVKGDRS